MCEGLSFFKNKNIQTELPGFQRAMNVTDPELVNMVLKIVAAPRPWYYGHVYDNGGDHVAIQSIANDDDPMIGTLMQISDYQLDAEDGMLRIGVQALGRFCIVGNVPPGSRSASVELLPDAELVEAHYREAKQAAASYDFALNQNARGAACAGAVAEAAEWHAYEFEPITLEQGRVDTVAKLNPNVMGSTTNSAVLDAMEYYLSQSPRDMYEGECILNFDNDVDDNEQTYDGVLLDQALALERDVWIKLDLLSQLLRQIDPKSNTNMPIPYQLLALLPKQPPQPWPESFSLTQYSQKMKSLFSLLERKKSKLLLGNSNLDTMETASDYPVLRRSRRLSYMIWELAEDLLTEHRDLLTEEKMILSMQDILEMTSISQRLYAASRKLEEINCVLQQVLDPD